MCINSNLHNFRRLPHRLGCYDDDDDWCLAPHLPVAVIVPFVLVLVSFEASYMCVSFPKIMEVNS